MPDAPGTPTQSDVEAPGDRTRLSTFITERPLPLGTAMGHAAAAVSDVREPVENEDLVTLTATFASGASGTLSASRVAYGLPNSLRFELFTESGAATFDLARAGELGFVDGTPPGVTQGYRQVLVGGLVTRT